jgi:hypothetical protein
MDTQTLGILVLFALPLCGVALFAWGHRHGVKTVTEAMNAIRGNQQGK